MSVNSKTQPASPCQERKFLEVLEFTTDRDQFTQELKNNISLHLLVSKISLYFPKKYSDEQRVNYTVSLLRNADDNNQIRLKDGKDLCLYYLYYELRLAANNSHTRLSEEEYLACCERACIDQTLQSLTSTVRTKALK